ncbi:MAG: serine/threonine-protein kinase [Deltaproteobacteria bacterium]
MPAQSSPGPAGFLQRRVQLAVILVLAMTSLMVVYGFVEAFIWRSMLSPTRSDFVFLAVLDFSLGGAAWYLHTAPRSPRVVYAIETYVLAGVGIGFTIAALRTPIGLRPELSLLLSLTVIMVSRTAFVPSSARRTLALCGMYAVPLAYIAWRTYVGYRSPGEGYPPLTSLKVTIYIQVWWAIITGSCVAISSVIFGLRQEVDAARQLGQYTLLDKLGAGGMGEVYRARHALLRRDTVVKLLRQDLVSEQAQSRFENEVQRTASLNHPNIVTVFDYGHTEDGVFYYAMELVDGATLDEVVQVGGPLPAARVAHILEGAARALEEAHGVGLVHRDIKPQNIMLTRRGRDRDAVKVLDFGLVKSSNEPAADGALTQDNAVVGTPLFLSPEAIRSPDGAAESSDLYALGAVAYFLLTGTYVFGEGTVVEICSHHLHTEPERPSARCPDAVIPEDLEALVLACLAKAPEDRPADAAAFLAALGAMSCSGQWTYDDAESWWASHASIVAERRGRPATMSSRTIAVDRR